MNGQFPGQDFNLLDKLPVTAYDLTSMSGGSIDTKARRDTGPECDSYSRISMALSAFFCSWMVCSVRFWSSNLACSRALMRWISAMV